VSEHDREMIVVHGHRRAFRRAGSGPPLLLIHGIGDDSASWSGVFDDLARDFTVIAPDLLGHGESDKPRADYSVGGFANGMRDLLEILDVDRVTVVGHSLGGGVAAQFAYQYPERCERLVLVSSGGVARAVSPALRLASMPVADIVLPIMNLPLGRLVTGWIIEGLRLSGNDLGRDAADLHRITDALPDVESRLAFTRTLRSVVDWRGQVVTMRDRVYLASAMPMMIVWGTNDGIIPVHHAFAAHAAVPSSRLEIYDGAGHFPHHHDPDRFTADLRHFIATTEPSSHDPAVWRDLLRAGAVTVEVG